MKKFAILFLALLIAVPAVTYAGSATSRWDMTLGGYVKFDVGYADQGQGVDYRTAARGGTNVTDKYGALSWAGGETRLNWAIKGPDTMGAKSSAFVEGDFRGVSGVTGAGANPGSPNYGTFTLRHAFMNFAWANSSLLIGHTWQPWGIIPTFNILAFSENHFMKGATRVPQIRFTQMFSKEWSLVLAAAANNQEFFGNSGANYIDDNNRSLWPDLSAEVKYSTDKCGKIGPWQLMFGAGGLFGREKVTWNQNTAAAPIFKDDDLNRWGFSFWGYIPIIPEKKGNKAGALGITGNFFTGQGLGIMLPAYPGYAQNTTAAYDYTTAGFGNGGISGNVDARYPMTYGFWAAAAYYFTDQVWFNFLYGMQSNQFSTGYQACMGAGTNKYVENYVGTLYYDPSPAVRFGLEYTYLRTQYLRATNAVTGERDGSMNAVRLGAYYFF